MKLNTALGMEIESVWELRPGQGQSWETFIAQVREAGNDILEEYPDGDDPHVVCLRTRDPVMRPLQDIYIAEAAATLGPGQSDTITLRLTNDDPRARMLMVREIILRGFYWEG